MRWSPDLRASAIVLGELEEEGRAESGESERGQGIERELEAEIFDERERVETTV